jgi:proteasome accessory factor C
VADERWLRRLLLRLTPSARVLSPKSYGEGAAEAARQTLALYDEPAG